MTFRWILILSIIASTAVLAYDTPFSRLDNLKSAISDYERRNGIAVNSESLSSPDPGLLEVITRSEYLSTFFYIGEFLFIGIFTIELIVRSIADGLILTPNPYLLNGWHLLDVFVLITMWLGVTTTFVAGSGLPRLLRACRAYRPLRLIAMSPGMKQVLSLVLSSMSQVMDAMALVLFFMVPYAVWGLSIFHNTFLNCNDSSVSTKLECIGSFSDPGNGLFTPRVWANNVNAFDTFWMSLLSLFEMIMEEGWSSKLYAGISIVGVDFQPQWPNPALPWWNAFYFLAWMMFGFVLLRYLFVGVILHTFMTRNGTALLTIEQRRWVDLTKKLKLVKPTKRVEPPVNNRFKTWCYNLVKDKNGPMFKFTTAAVVLNLVFMATEYQPYQTFADGSLGIGDPYFLLNPILRGIPTAMIL